MVDYSRQGRFECTDIDGDRVYLRELVTMDRWRPGPSRYERAFPLRLFDAVDFRPEVGMQFDMTFELQPSGERLGRAHLARIHITAISNVTD